MSLGLKTQPVDQCIHVVNELVMGILAGITWTEHNWVAFTGAVYDT